MPSHAVPALLEGIRKIWSVSRARISARSTFLLNPTMKRIIPFENARSVICLFSS